MLLDADREGRHVGQREAARQLRGSHAPRQLQQRQRIATCLGDDPVADVVIESASDDSREQSARVLLGEPSQLQLRQAYELGFVGRLADSEHDHHRLRQQPSSDKSEDLTGGVIEPLRVIDQAQQRPLGGDLGQ